MVLEHDHAAVERCQSVVNAASLRVPAGTILVTGGTGFVGQSLVEALVQAGARVRVLVRGALPTDWSAGQVELAPGDILDARAVRQAVTGVSALVHAAGGRAPDVAAMWRANVEGTRLLAQEAKRAGVRRFVHISSAGVYGHRHDERPFCESDATEPDSAYGYSKLEAERALRAELTTSELGWSILRPYGIYGPRRLEFFREVRRRRVWLYGPAKIVVHPTYVDDVATAVIKALELAEHAEVRGEAFNVAGERAVEHFEHVELVARALGLTARRLVTPRWVGNAVQPFVALGWGPLGRLSNQPLIRSADLTKTRRLLAWQPLPLRTAITATIEAARARGQL